MTAQERGRPKGQRERYVLQKIYRNYQELKREEKKGFTLMEMIVVLVIMSILAAIAIPSMMGWIEDAKQKQVLIGARNAYMAVQTVILEEYARGELEAETLTTEQIEKAGVYASFDGEILSGSIDPESGVITEFSYVQDEHMATYKGAADRDGQDTDGAGWTIGQK